MPTLDATVWGYAHMEAQPIIQLHARDLALADVPPPQNNKRPDSGDGGSLLGQVVGGWRRVTELVGQEVGGPIDPSAAFRRALREQPPDTAVSVDAFYLEQQASASARDHLFRPTFDVTWGACSGTCLTLDLVDVVLDRVVVDNVRLSPAGLAACSRRATVVIATPLLVAVCDATGGRRGVLRPPVAL